MLLAALTSMAMIAPTPSSAAPDKSADPTVAGKHRVSRVEYDAGLTLLGPDTTTGTRTVQPMPSRLHGSLHVSSAPGPRPVVLLQHGRHSTCALAGRETFGHPCPDTPVTADVRSFAGYDYLAENLASHGYLVMSIDANGVNTHDLADLTAGALARAQLISRSLDLLRSWSTTPGPAPVGGRLIGRVDLNRLGLMGHSRGGEGVTYWLDYNRRRTDGPRYRASAVFSLAPIDATAQAVSGVPYATLLPMCDGDVYDLQGAAVFERSKYAAPLDNAPKLQLAVEGANHNFFNTTWTGDDYFGSDFACSTKSDDNARMTPEQQRRVGLATIGAFLRRFVGPERRLDALIAGRVPWTPACSRGLPVRCADLIRSSYIAGHDRRTLLLVPGSDENVTSQGRRVLTSGLSTYAQCEAGSDDRPCPGASGFDAANRSPGPQITVAWDRQGTLTVPVAVGSSRGATHLVVRTGVNWSDDRNPESDGLDPRSAVQDFDVVLIDRSGRIAAVTAARWGPALHAPLGSVVRNLVLSDVRIPLTAFGNIDLEKVSAISLRFGRRTATGSIQLADLSLQR